MLIHRSSAAMARSFVMYRRRDRVAECFDSPDGIVATVEGNEELSLQLLAAGRREVQLEVGQPLIPGADAIESVGAGFGWMVEDGVELADCQCRIEEAGWRRGCSALVD